MRADDFLNEGGLVSFLKKLGTDAVDYAVGKAPKVKNYIDQPKDGMFGGRVPGSANDVTHAYRNMSPEELAAAKKSGYFEKNPNPVKTTWDTDTKYWSQGDAEGYFGRSWKDVPHNAQVRLPQDKLPRWTAGRTGDAEVLDKTTGAWNSVKENTDHDKDGRAVEELRAALLDKQDQLQSATDDQVYDIIDRIMTRIAKSHNISGKKLHDMWVRKYKQIPDTWVMTEAKTTREDFEGITIEMVENGHVLVINALDDWGNNILGSVAFNIHDNNELDPQDLKVNERYQGQGIARAMYDYAKSKGYKIHRSYDQTDAGAGFWNKHRGEEVRVWENQNVAEGKIKLYTDPSYFGAEVDDAGFDSLPVVNISADRLVGFEPDSKMQQPKSRVNVEKIVAGLKKGDKLPPLLVRKYKNGYQVLDGHHRFWAYKLSGTKSISVRIVADKDIEEISKQGVAEGLDDNGISFQVQKGKNKFATTLSMGNNPVGVYQYNATTGRSIAEVYPEFKGKGLGKLLVLHAIYTATQLGLDFQEDESRTSEYDNVLDSLSSNGYIVDDDGYWYVTGEGEQYLKQSLKQDVAENFADGKNPGRKGLAKRSGVNTKASVSSLRKTAKNSSGEKQRMAHWLANMKSGRNKNK